MNQLLSITEIIKKARAMGLSFGHGDAKTHLAYLAKIHLIPPATRRKIDGKMTGCYPGEVIDLLNRIEEMKVAGLSYSEMKWQLAHSSSPTVSSTFLSAYAQKITPEKWFNPAVYLVVGLLLGYFLAINRPAPTETLAGAAVSSNDGGFTASIRKVPAGEVKDSAVYIISLPNQHLDNLGKTNISRLESY